MNIVIDIETLRCPDFSNQAIYLRNNVKADSRLKDEAKIAADIMEKRATVIEKSSLDGGFGMIAVLGTGTLYGGDQIEFVQYSNGGSCLDDEHDQQASETIEKIKRTIQ